MDISNLWRKKIKSYQKVFGSEEGRIVLHDLYKLCKINNPSYVENSPDKTAFNEGVKYVAYYLKNTLKQSTADIDKFLEEYDKSAKRNILKGVNNVRR
jgi:hypothetical protein